MTTAVEQPFWQKQIGELSGGQKKRVFLARALAQEGQVVRSLGEVRQGGKA